MSRQMKIYAENDAVMLNIVDGLVRKSLTFEVVYHDGNWVIYLTGGY